MLGIKTTIVAFCAGVILAGGIAWTYQGNRYQLKIEEMVSAHNAELAKETEKVLERERENNDITRQIEINAVDAQKRIDALTNANAAIVRKYGGMYLAGQCEEVQAGTPSATASVPAEETPACRVSDETATALLDIARDADSTAVYANACYEYAKAVEAQRERMKNE